MLSIAEGGEDREGRVAAVSGTHPRKKYDVVMDVPDDADLIRIIGNIHHNVVLLPWMRAGNGGYSSLTVFAALCNRQHYICARRHPGRLSQALKSALGAPRQRRP